MKFLRSNFPIALIVIATICLQACSAKKKVVETPPPVDTVATPAPTPPPPPPPAPEPVPAPPPPPAPDYNFSNVQFEFNSAVLRTESYPVLDKVAAEMKKDLAVSFTINGYASAEGSDAHNMKLSADRANAVKTYLVNGGINGANLATQGYGEKNPIGDNKTDAGRALNRRVEIKKK